MTCRRWKITMGMIVLMVAIIPSVQGSMFSRPKGEKQIRSKLESLPPERKGRLKAQLHSDLGTILYKEGRMKKAAKEFETALTYSPSKKLKRHIYLYLGKCYESYERVDKAVSAYEEALLVDKKNWKRHRDLAFQYETIQLYDRAVEYYQHALHRKAKDPTVLTDLGRTYRKMGLYKNAEIYLKMGQKEGDDSLTVPLELARVYEGQARFEEAATTYRITLDEKSSAQDWGRFVYLSVLAKNKAFANQGLQHLQDVKTLPDTLSFYEEIVEWLDKSPEQILTSKVSDPTLKSLIKSVVESPLRDQSVVD